MPSEGWWGLTTDMEHQATNPQPRTMPWGLSANNLSSNPWLVHNPGPPDGALATPVLLQVLPLSSCTSPQETIPEEPVTTVAKHMEATTGLW